MVTTMMCIYTVTLWINSRLRLQTCLPKGTDFIFLVLAIMHATSNA